MLLHAARRVARIEDARARARLRRLRSNCLRPKLLRRRQCDDGSRRALDRSQVGRQRPNQRCARARARVIVWRI